MLESVLEARPASGAAHYPIGLQIDDAHLASNVSEQAASLNGRVVVVF